MPFMIYKILSLHVGCIDNSNTTGREGERMINVKMISFGVVTLTVCKDRVH